MLNHNKKSILLSMIMFIPLCMLIFINSCKHNPTPPDGKIDGKDAALLQFLYLINYAESIVSQANTRFKDNAEKLNKAKNFYNQAAAKGNAFIEFVQIKLTERSIADTELRPKAQEIGDTVATLERYVSTGGEPGVPMVATPAELIAGLIDGLVKGGINVWKAIQDQKDKIINETKEELNKRRWKDWETLQRDSA